LSLIQISKLVINKFKKKKKQHKPVFYFAS